MVAFKDELVTLMRDAANEGVCVTSKDRNRGLWELLNLGMQVITLRHCKNIVTDYASTLGNIVYFPAGWNEENATERDYIVLRHELEHIRQYKKLGNGHIWWGFVLFSLLYLFVPLPTVFAWFRYKFERNAYLESWRAARDLDKLINIESYVKILSGPDYFWAWPFKPLIRRWFEKRCI